MALKRTSRTSQDRDDREHVDARAVDVVEEAPRPRPVGKGRPTPSRASAQAARRRPLVPGNRKEAARTERQRSRESRAKARAGALAGDDRYLPTRDRGPVRRLVRDVVDSRYNIGENLLIIAFVVLIGNLVGTALAAGDPAAQATVGIVANAVLLSLVITIVVDGVLLRRRVRAAVTDRFGAEAAGEKGLTFYAVMRALQLRRGRTPGVAVARGEAPRPTR